MITKLQNQNFFDKIRPRFYPGLNVEWNIYRQENKTDKGRKTFSLEERTNIVIEGQGQKIPLTELCFREGISLNTFDQWTKEFLNRSEVGLERDKLTDEDKFKIVIEGKSGETSIAEICRREQITQDMFLDWSRKFIELRRSQLDKFNLLNPTYQKNKQLIVNFSNSNELFPYFENYIDFSTEKSLVVLKSSSRRLNKTSGYHNIISLEKINNVRYINKYFEKVNAQLNYGGIFIGCLETFKARKERMRIKHFPLISDIYFSFEFIFKRVLPKVSFTKKYYFDFTKGSDRLLSKAEGLGRLVSCGFRIMDYKTIDGLLYFVVKKVQEPVFDMSPSYGPLYKMPRLGKNGDIIGVYKFRTMHPYSEYIQDYVVNANGYARTGKPADDFRIPAWGKFMRRLWLDELPQLINVFKGEMKLVGIRPVSKRYFQDIPREMQKLRLTQKPGCIPPYVALNREGNVMSVLQSEREYLEEKIRNPYTTDLKYFLKAIFNIVVNHKRSA